MSIERTSEGVYIITDIVDGQLITKRYYGYTKAEAVARFKKESK